jgi:hypothetical protein
MKVKSLTILGEKNTNLMHELVPRIFGKKGSGVLTLIAFYVESISACHVYCKKENLQLFVS